MRNSAVLMDILFINASGKPSEGEFPKKSVPNILLCTWFDNFMQIPWEDLWLMMKQWQQVSYCNIHLFAQLQTRWRSTPCFKSTSTHASWLVHCTCNCMPESTNGSANDLKDDTRIRQFTTEEFSIIDSCRILEDIFTFVLCLNPTYSCPNWAGFPGWPGAPVSIVSM